MKSPQSPHSSSLWVFALSLRVLSELSPSAAISHLATKLSLYSFSVVGLRVISVLGICKLIREVDQALISAERWLQVRSFIAIGYIIYITCL